MLGFALGVAGDSLLRDSETFVDLIACYSSRVLIGILVVDLDIFLDVAGASVLLVTVLESVHARFEQRLIIPKL